MVGISRKTVSIITVYPSDNYYSEWRNRIPRYLKQIYSSPEN